MENLRTYLENRRSAVSVTLQEPGPSDAQVQMLLQIASRVPDHGKLAPWRFELWRPQYRKKLHGQLSALIQRDDAGNDKLQAGTDKILHAPCVVAVISAAKESEKVPLWEQHLSAGASCLLLLQAANALGFGAQWLTGWYVYDERARALLGLNAHETIAGLIHIGSTVVKQTDRPRPDLSQIFTIREA